MPESNAEIVHLCAEAFNRGDLDGWVSFWDPDDAVFEDRNPGPDQESVTRGLGNIRSIIEAWRESMPDFRIEIGEMLEVGDALAYRITYRGTGGGSGAETEFPMVDVCWLREGKITHLRSGLESLAEGRRAVEEDLRAQTP